MPSNINEIKGYTENANKFIEELIKEGYTKSDIFRINGASKTRN
jgi:hypothetical protein